MFRGGTSELADAIPESFDSISRELRCTLDRNGRVRAAAGAWEATLGRPPWQLHGWKLEDLVHEPDRRRLARALRRLQEGRGAASLELRLETLSGNHRVMSWSLTVSAVGDGLVGVGVDRTDERRRVARSRRALGRLERRNRELESRVRELEERNTAVERFAAIAAHQLTEPLVVAESSAIMLSEELAGELEPLHQDRLEAIGRSAARTRRLIDALLAEARSADRPPKLRPVDSRAVVQATLTELEDRMESRGVTAVLGELPTLKSEPHLLSVIFENLLSNAIKYGPRGGGEVGIAAERIPFGWRFCIESEGAPISAEDAQRIFEPFRRAAVERRITGSGLGLAICARLVGRLGGTMGVWPGRTEGNRFFFELPDAG